MFKRLIVITISFFLYHNQAVPTDLKIVYVDLEKIINESNAGKKVSKELENLNKKNVDKFKKKEKEIADEKKKLIKQKNILSKEDFEKKIKALQSKINLFKKDINESRINIDKKRVNATTEILAILNPILSDYSSKNSISFILQKKYIIIGKTELEITKQILDLLNAKLKSIKLK